MLKFSANLSLLFTELPLIDRFHAARKAGFKAVEIQFPYELSIDTLKSVLKDTELPLVLINIPAGDLMQGGDGLACVPGREQDFSTALELAEAYARELNVPTVNALAGRQPEGLLRDECLNTLTENLQKALPIFRKNAIQLVTEAINIFDMPRFLIHSLNDMQLLCQQVPGLLMQFDGYHMARMGEDIEAALNHYLPQIGHIQFADAPGRHEPGTGSLELAHFFSLIRDSHYTQWCGAEYIPSKPTTETLQWLSRWQTTTASS